MPTTSTSVSENIHSVVNFNPADYEVLDYLDNKRPQYVGQPIAAWEAEIQMWKRQILRYFPTSAVATTGAVQQLPEHNIHKCRHCGNTNVRYIVACKHIPSGTNVVFGDVCVDHLGFANHQQFRAAQLRARAAQGNASLRAYQKRLAFLEQHPAFKEAIESGEVLHPVHANNTFAQDVLAKFNKYGELSPRQVESLLRSLERDHEYARRRVEREREDIIRRATAQPAPSGRVMVEGKIMSAKNYDAQFGGVRWKMLVLLTTGAKVFASIPSNLDGNPSELRGKCVRFTAKFFPKEGDPYFAYGSRPSKAELIACPATVENVSHDTQVENDISEAIAAADEIRDGEEV